MSDFEWCCERVLGIVQRAGADDVAWEDFIVRLLVEKKYHSSWNDRATWVECEAKHRTTLIYYAIEHLIQKKRIHVVPGSVQAAGRRRFRVTNILDSIVQSL